RSRGCRRLGCRCGRLGCGGSRRGFGCQVLTADGPRAGALCLQDVLGDTDLLRLRGLVRAAAAAVGLPGALRELQAAVVAVAGVDGPVATALALGDAVPVVLGG